jgi:hypothetical protein
MTEFQTIKQNYTHVPGFGNANAFTGKSLEKTSITFMSSDFEKPKKIS